ncbi:MAG TPA: HNH endonuclease [Acidimicrobiales bacterium]
MRRQYTPGPLPFLPFLQVELTCQQCSVRFLVSRQKAGRQRFCSPACRDEAQRIRLERVCVQCGRRFAVIPSNTRNGRGRHCSVACVNEGQRRPWITRFWERVTKTDTCWLWTGYRQAGRYGMLRVVEGATRTVGVHRLSWELHYGPIPDGLLVCHTCDVRACVRPDHLFLGTPTDNVQDMLAKGRGRLGDAHPNARLTAESVREIRRQRAEEGATGVDLAQRFGVGRSTVYRMLHRETWVHL